MNKANLIAYHGDPAIKDKYLARVRAHRKADDLIRGTYWSNGKGCAVGCTVHSSSHAAYETELGIPRILARLEDGIFEGLANGAAMEWPERFLSATEPGTNLGGVSDKFLHWLLVDPTDGVIRFAKTEHTKWAIQRVGDLYALRIKGEKVSPAAWRAAAAADADAAADAAAAAADAAAADADADAAAWRADAAAWRAAAAAADADADADAAWQTLKAKARGRQADKLVELLREAQP